MQCVRILSTGCIHSFLLSLFASIQRYCICMYVLHPFNATVYACTLCVVGVFCRCRKVKDESSTGSSTSSRVRTVLTISIEAIEFDTAACELRVKGKNIQENQYVKMGAYHTIDLQLNQKFTLAKQNWDVIALDRLGIHGDWLGCAVLLCLVVSLTLLASFFLPSHLSLNFFVCFVC